MTSVERAEIDSKTWAKVSKRPAGWPACRSNTRVGDSTPRASGRYGWTTQVSLSMTVMLKRTGSS